MKESNLFMRGQVWYWEDPIYGKKEEGNKVDIGESTQRYNRYVLIVQDGKTIDLSAILVLPISSSKHVGNDIPIHIRNLFDNSCGYAKCRNMFPVHPRFLTRYVCTVSDEVMSRVDAELIKLILPSISNLPHDKVKALLGIDLDAEIINDFVTPKKNVDLVMRSFVRNHLVHTGKVDDVLSIYDLKDAFDAYVMKTKVDCDIDIVSFIESFATVTNVNNLKYVGRVKFQKIEISGVKLIGDLRLSFMLPEKDSISPKDPQRSLAKWDDETKKRFILIYEDRGQEAAAEVFKLKPSSAQNYYYKWKAQLKAVEEKQVDEEVVEERKPMIPLPSTNDIAYAISSFVNKVNEYLRSNMIWDTYKKGNKYVVSEDEFYRKMCAAMYYSLFSLLGIVKNADDVFDIPKLKADDPYIDTWSFFDNIHHDTRINRCDIAEDVMDMYHKYYNPEGGIDKEWISLLNSKIKILRASHDVDSICALLEYKFCSK